MVGIEVVGLRHRATTGLRRPHQLCTAVTTRELIRAMSHAFRGIRSAQLGLLVNAVLAATKLVAGIVGNSYALIADAVESSADIIGSLVVWGGLAIAAQPADEDHPFGHGKAEAIAAAVVAVMLIGAALGIGVQAVHEIQRPPRSPRPCHDRMGGPRRPAARRWRDRPTRRAIR